MKHSDLNEDATSTDIEQELDRILLSPEFSQATRLKEFLTYIVTESRQGRGGMILGKTIAQDVYASGADIEGNGLNLVKVDAGRLRRRLDDYYAGSGIGDPIRILIPRGGYTPGFECLGPEDTGPQDTGPQDTGPDGITNMSLPAKPVLFGSISALAGVSAIGFVILIAVVAWSQNWLAKTGTSNIGTRAIAERQAILAKSPSALQAFNIARQARALIFPPTDPIRLQASRDMFERAIKLDAEYFGGYAGAAQVLGLQALFSPPGPVADTLLATARQRADRAVELRPDASWSQSASAWVHFVSREFDQANEVSVRAVALDPMDFDALDFDSLIALFSGDFERALQSSDPARHQGRAGSRFAFSNIYAVASFHVGRYQDTIRFLNEAAAKGDPISQISVVYLAAAYLKTGNTKRAEDKVNDFENTWPNSRIDLLFTRAFKDQRYAFEVMEAFKSAGWSPP